MRLCFFGLVILTITASVFTSCQDDIPLLGQDENGIIVPRDSVYIKYIALFSFPANDPATGSSWDDTNSVTDPYDSLGLADIFFNSYNINDLADTFFFFQATHFSNVLNTDTTVYYFTDPVQIPHFYDSLYLRIYDAEIDTPAIDSTLIDSILFVIGPDTTQTNPYIPAISRTGFNGSQVAVGLDWK